MKQTLHCRRLWLVLAYAVLFAVVIFSLISIQPRVQFAHADKWKHLLGYCALMFSFGLVYPQQRWHIAILFIAIGWILEVAQYWLPYRVYEWQDASANSAGVILGLILLYSPLQGLIQRIDKWLARSCLTA